ncbi:MAG: hypothetical protein L0271_21015 [Gemmatimonadetes bacterium]|nr:hypothetical protein [Gemmatimonadota bacterium]
MQGVELHSLLVQPKRLALVAYLTLARPARFHRRDSLLALFWPESDTERARLALRQALHFLRKALGEGVIVSRGDEEVGIAPGAIWSDVIAFENAVDAGRYAEALDLYRGDLLSGFFVPDVSPDVEQWLDAERARLRARAAAAAWDLVDAAEGERNGLESSHWARKAVGCAPDDEAGVRRLIALLDRWGDRAGALRVHAEFARRLKKEYEVDPAAETRALIDTVRDREQATAHAGFSAPPAGAAFPDPGDDRQDRSAGAPPGHDETGDSHARSGGRPPRTRRQRAYRFAGGAIVLSLLASGVATLLLGSSRESPPRLAIGTITNEAGSSMEEMARLLPGLLSTDLSRVDGLTILSRSRLLEVLRQLGQHDETTEALSNAASRAGATEIIEGALYRQGEALRLDLRRVDLIRGVVRRSYSASGSNEFELADRVTAEIARGFSLAVPAVALAATGSGSLVARRFHEEGLRAYYGGEWRAAYQLFSTALAEDSSFAMAAYYAAKSVRPFDIDSEFVLLVRAEQLAHRAPERDRLIIRYARYLHDYPVRAAVAESLAVRFPSEPDGHLAMASVHIAAGDFSAAIPYARRVIAMDSLSLQGKTPVCRACDAFRALLSAYAAMGTDSFPAVERVAREWIQRQPGSSSAWLTLAAALNWRGRQEDALQALNHATQLQPAQAHMYEHPSTMPAIMFESAVIKGENWVEAERPLRDRLAFDERDYEAVWWLITTLRNQGRITEALLLAEKADRFALEDGHLSSRTWVYVKAQLLFELGRFRDAAQHFESLMRVDPDEPTDPGYRVRTVSYNGVLAAMAWAAAGDTLRLQVLADTIERVANLTANNGIDWHLPHHVRGLLWQARGQPARAAQEFRTAIYSPTLGYTRTNLELARALMALNQPEDAIRILREALAGPSDGPGYHVTHTEVHDCLARGFEAAGQPDSALVHYRRVAEAWNYGDPPYRARAEQARRKIQALQR